METARYVVALIAVALFPPSIIHWILVHALTRLWRMIGLIWTYAITLTIFTCFAVGVYLLRDVILRVHFGTNWILIGLSVFLLCVETGVEVQCRRWLSAATLVGIPELSQAGSGSALLKDGIYGRVRHPRYVGGSMGLLSMALFSNYLAVYILLAMWFPGLYLVTLLEEKELVARFGEEYQEYQRRTPRFIPRMFSEPKKK
jgi:protein-S-isoprenylcysteine O-methyltransferase Ste14